MKEVGVVLGVGESRVSQIHSSAMIRLRELELEDIFRFRMRTVATPLPRDLLPNRAQQFY